MSIRIRDYTDDDYGAIISLLIEGVKPFQKIVETAYVERLFEENIDFKTDIMRVFDLPGAGVVGFYRYCLWPREAQNPTSAYLLDIDVLEGYQRRGYGSLLVGDLIRRLRQRDIRKLFSRTFESNSKSNNFHLKIGFRILRKIHESYLWQLELL